MKNIVILAAGPTKENRNRHLEVFNDQVLIDKIIEECTIRNTKLYIVINLKNKPLIKHIQTFFNNTKILYPKDEKIYSTLEAALSPDGDCILVVGDLINLKKGDVKKFVDSKYKCATCGYKKPWGPNISSAEGNLIRRGDVGDCISMISQEYKLDFLSKKNQSAARQLFKMFYPNGNKYKKINEYWYNDIGTFMSFAFFKEIWSKPPLNFFEEKGLIFFDHAIYIDND